MSAQSFKIGIRENWCFLLRCYGTGRQGEVQLLRKTGGVPCSIMMPSCAALVFGGNHNLVFTQVTSLRRRGPAGPVANSQSNTKYKKCAQEQLRASSASLTVKNDRKS